MIHKIKLNSNKKCLSLLKNYIYKCFTINNSNNIINKMEKTGYKLRNPRKLMNKNHLQIINLNKKRKKLKALKTILSSFKIQT